VHSFLKKSIPHQTDGVSFSRGVSDMQFLVFGGYENSSYWIYNTESNVWTEQMPQLSNIIQGGATVDPNQGIGYYLGGRVDNEWVDGLLSCDLSNWRFQNHTLPLNSLSGLFLEYLPVGKSGILVFFGGRNSTVTVGCHFCQQNGVHLSLKSI